MALTVRPGPSASSHRADRILVIEDEEPLRRALSVSLQAHGFEVVALGTGEEGVACAGGFDPTCVLVDLNLPGVTGTQVVWTLRRQTDTRIVAMSADTATDARSKVLAAGADAFLPKPFSMRTLLNHVRHLPRDDRDAEEGR